MAFLAELIILGFFVSDIIEIALALIHLIPEDFLDFINLDDHAVIFYWY